MHHQAHDLSRPHLRFGVILLVKLMVLALLLVLLGHLGAFQTLGMGLIAAHVLIAGAAGFFLLRRLAVHGRLTGVSQAEPDSGILMRGAAAYDLLAWVMTFGREGWLRERLLGLIAIRPGDSVLDVASGTGTLAILAKQYAGPAGHVAGIDAAPEMVARAKAKAEKAGADVAFTVGTAQQLPFGMAQFDVVMGTMMLHHLTPEGRKAFAAEARRVVKPGGRILLVDFADNPHGPRRAQSSHLVDAAEIQALLADSGLERVGSGPVGFKGLYYVVAAPSGSAADGEPA